MAMAGWQAEIGPMDGFAWSQCFLPRWDGVAVLEHLCLCSAPHASAMVCEMVRFEMA
jgi:hypothetical protein